jgi:5'-deoxynucleotidase YfbR-like HD superfamily hydrolase
MDTRTQTQTHNNDGVATLAVLHRKLKGGYVKRYHTRPELADNQDVAAHSWRATVLLHTLWPDASKECLLHMLYHDVPEGELGDLPATTKWRHPILADYMATLEARR